MNEQSAKMVEAYYRNAASWNSDRLRAMRSSRRTAWLVAGAATLTAMLEAGALFVLIPLKTVEPYTLLVDKTTGYVQPLKPLDPAKVAPDTALTQSYLVQYVLARESFDISTASSSYRKVALLSAGNARSSYLATMQPSNPQSPLVVYPRGTTIETRIKSISPVGRDAALVRFDTVKADANGRAQPAAPWVALIRYHYSGEPMKLEDRFVNPLGFQVVKYRRDPEALAPEPIANDTAPTAAASRTTSGAMVPAPAASRGLLSSTPASPARGQQ